MVLVDWTDKILSVLVMVSIKVAEVDVPIKSKCRCEYKKNTLALDQ